MTKTEFIALLNEFSVKAASAAVIVSAGHKTVITNDELIRCWQEITDAVDTHWRD